MREKKMSIRALLWKTIHSHHKPYRPQIQPYVHLTVGMYSRHMLVTTSKLPRSNDLGFSNVRSDNLHPPAFIRLTLSFVRYRTMLMFSSARRFILSPSCLVRCCILFGVILHYLSSIRYCLMLFFVFFAVFLCFSLSICVLHLLFRFIPFFSN